MNEINLSRRKIGLSHVPLVIVEINR